MTDSKSFWFPAKRYGWGWGLPVTWQGWAVLIGYVLLLGAGALLFPPTRDTPAFIVCTALLTALLITICYFKGERPSWRWGDK